MTGTGSEQLIVASKLMQHYRVFTPLSAGTQIQAVGDQNDKVQLITVGNDGNLYNLYQDAGSDTGWQIASLNTAQLNNGAVTGFFASLGQDGILTVNAQFTNTGATNYSLSDARWSPGWQKVGAGAGLTAKPAGAAVAQFSVQNGELLFKAPGGQQIKLSGNVQVSTTYQSGHNFAGFLEVFILGMDGSLYHVRAAPDLVQPPGPNPDPEAAAGWTHMIQLNPVQTGGKLQFSQLSLTQDQDGYPTLFAVDRSDNLWSVRQDADTSDWTFTEIELPDYDPQNEGKPSQVSVYLTEMTVLDATGAPRPTTTVTIWSSDETPAVINGSSTRLDSLTPYLCTANSAGKVTVVVEADSIDAPILKVTTDFMNGEEYIEIEPNAYIQNKLRTINAAGISNATNVFSGQPVTVVSGNVSQDTLNAVASGVSQCMSLAGTPVSSSDPVDIPGPASEAKFLARNKNLAGLRYVAKPDTRFHRRIDLSRVEEQHWRFVFDHKTKNHRFETLGRAQAATLMAERRSSLKSADSLSDWFDVDWGDVWEDIESVAEFVVSTVVDTVTNVVTAIETQINLIIDGVTYLFETVVDKIEQVFDAIEGIFEAVGAFFEQMFDWLAFLFSWNDILLTQQAIAKLISDVALPFATQTLGAGGTVNTLLKSQIQSFQANLNQSFNAFLNSPGIKGQNSIVGVQGTVPPSDLDDQTAGTNLALSALLDKPDAAVLSSGSRQGLLASASGSDPFSVLMTDLSNTLPGFFSDPAFTTAAAYFEAIGNNPDQFLSNALNAIVSTIQGVLNVGLNVASAVIDAIFEVVQAALSAIGGLLTAKIYVPLASELYTMVTGQEDMTILGLFSLIAAIPTTIVYKLLFNKAPFAEEADVSQFIASMNASLGSIGGAHLAARPGLRAASGVAVPNGLLQFTGCVLICAYPIYGVIEAVLDAWIVPPDVPLAGEGIGLLTGIDKYADPPAALSWAAIALEWTIFIASLPSTLAAPSCANADSIGTLAWLIGGLSPALDSGWMIATQKLGSGGTIMRNSGTIGTAADWILAMTQFGMLCAVVAKQADEGKVDAASTTQAFFAAVPGLFKFFRLPPVNRWEPGLAILAVLDIVGDFGSGVAEVVVVSNLQQMQSEAPAALSA